MKQPSLPTLNTLLSESGIEVEKVLIMRHRPWEPSLNLVFDSIAMEHPELFGCYQSTHGPKTETALKRANYLASFIRTDPGKALFIGLFSIEGYRTLPAAEVVNRPLHKELVRMGMSGDFASRRSEAIAEFSLDETDWGEAFKKRLIIKWPGADRAWYQWVDRRDFEIEAISPQEVLRTNVPPWNEMCPTWAELRVLPTRWQEALRQWRGIYLITDMSDGKQYVGSAAGSENLLQRWRAYSVSGHGGNKQLKSRDPQNFRYSILERVSPDAPRDQVINLENNWKVRLHSTWPNGLNEN